MSRFSVANKLAIVTGASSGIGAALAQGLAAEGARVVLVARREEKLRQVLEAIHAQGHEGSGYIAQALDSVEAVDGLVAQCRQDYGDADILVNAAGLNKRQAPEDISSASWDETLGINTKVPFFLARALVPAMKAQAWGKVINIASLQSARAFENGLAYGASKGAVVQLTRAMAEAWSRYGISCNAIAPGFFPTELTAAVFANEALAAKNAAQTCVGRNGRLEDLLGTTIFLASAASDYVTGQTIFVDGGFTAK